MVKPERTAHLRELYIRAERAARSARMAILADDLTGALDCAAAFASNGISTFVSIHSFLQPSDHDVVSVNMNTRGNSPEVARDKIYTQTLRQTSSGHFVKFVKIDSTLRGHPGIEIGTAVAASSASIVLVAPSFPATGRTVTDGQLLVHGELLTTTEVGKDPVTPVNSSSVKEVLAEHSQLPIRVLSLDDVRAGKLLDRLGKITAHGDGPYLVLCDAEIDADLDAIAKAGLQFELAFTSETLEQRRGAMFAGSAGLASALARQVGDTSNTGTHEDLEFGEPIMVVTASQRTLADDQIAALATAGIAELQEVLIEVTTDGLTSPANLDLEAMNLALGAHKNLVVRAVASGDLRSMPPPAVQKAAKSITEQLGQLVASLVSQHHIGGLVIIGGDTANAVLTAVSARGIVLAAEPLPGVPVGTIVGGALDGVPVATKAGAFGNEQTLVDLFQNLGRSK